MRKFYSAITVLIIIFISNINAQTDKRIINGKVIDGIIEKEKLTINQA